MRLLPDKPIALNAAIEAARAEKVEKVFLVVADEVGKASPKSTFKHKEIIENVQKILEDVTLEVNPLKML